LIKINKIIFNIIKIKITTIAITKTSTIIITIITKWKFNEHDGWWLITATNLITIRTLNDDHD